MHVMFWFSLSVIPYAPGLHVDFFSGKMAFKAEAEGIPACHLGISHGSTGYARLGCGTEIIELMEREQ